MKHVKLFTIISIICAGCMLAGCTKQAVSTPEAFNSSNTGQATGTSAKNLQLVLTPRGLMPKMNVHFIESNYSLNISGSKIQKIENATGRVIEEFEDAADNSTIGTDAFASGWITYANWFNDTSKPVTYFTTNWKVPTAPPTNSGQTLFLFNGMQDGFGTNAHILQPVLQWGFSAAGGGAYWSVTNWYVGTFNAFYGSLVKVATGTDLQGIMQATARNGYKYNYNSSFKGYPAASALQVNNARQLYWAAETLESYGVTKNSDYPSDVKVAMTNIRIIREIKDADINWAPVNPFGTPQHTVIVSNNSPGGKVDIYWH